MSKKGKIKTKATINHLIHNDKKKKSEVSLLPTEDIQIYKNNDPLSLNLVNKNVLSDLLKLEMVLDFRIS